MNLTLHAIIGSLLNQSIDQFKVNLRAPTVRRLWDVPQV